MSAVCRAISWLLLAALIFVTLCPIKLRPVSGAPPDLERFVAFAVLGAIFAFGYPKNRVIILFFLVAFAGSLEALQQFIPTRDARVHDAVIKAIGAFMGVFIARAMLQLRRPKMWSRRLRR